MGPHLVVVGHILDEIIRFPDREVGPVLGGPAAYASAAASILGMPTGLVTVVDPAPAEHLLGPLREAGVDLAGVRRRGRTRTSVLSYDESGAKSIAYKVVGPAITVADVPEPYRRASAFFICPLDFEVPETVFAFLRARGGLIAADLGGLGGAVATRHPVADPAAARDVQGLVAMTEIVKASDEDCKLITGFDDPETSARTILGWGSRVAIVTMGADGAFIHERAGFRGHIPALPVAAVDTTGAGDVFCGAFLAEYLRTGAIVDAARYGATAAGIVVERTGGASPSRFPGDAEVRLRMATATRSRSI